MRGDVKPKRKCVRRPKRGHRQKGRDPAKPSDHTNARLRSSRSNLD